MQVITSNYALAEPKLKEPFTADMADIVDAFRRNGLIKKQPAAFQIGQKLIIHPILWEAIKREKAVKMQSYFDDQFLSLMRG